ncbi:AraC family transcriptional regulator [uncultured Chitinophaga sp.]|jgi:AraC-type DNA-binding domain-containing proteins|uniref:helix-turn-helix domain-containing protein n=1 Tax=uncultured Chitinophaga sp. TaxID=339340 RepID=UPI00262CDE48|nr:helix-turn-helix domain-containing protein [uncultured Chitinophaga sp.]
MADPGRRYPVDPRLAGVLSHCYAARTPPGMQPQLYHLAPSLEMIVVFNFGAAIPYAFGDEAPGAQVIDRIVILGPLRCMMNYQLQADSDLLVLQFILDGFYRFLSVTPGEEAAVAERLEDVWHLLAAIPDTEQRIAALTDYLLLHIAQSEPPTQQLLDHVDDIHNPVVNPVKVIAGRYGVSARAVQLRFKKYVGYSPKELLRFLRFKQVLAYLLDHPAAKVNWFELVVQFGYHDQSHLIRDFKHYTGVSPRQFMQLNEDDNFCIGRD